jgi:TPR repeat protein
MRIVTVLICWLLSLILLSGCLPGMKKEPAKPIVKKQVEEPMDDGEEEYEDEDEEGEERKQYSQAEIAAARKKLKVTHRKLMDSHKKQGEEKAKVVADLIKQKREEVYQKECEQQDNNESCYAYGLIMEVKERGTVDARRKYFKKGCIRGHAESCISMANTYFQPKKKKLELNPFLEYLGKACKLGKKDVCEAYNKIVLRTRKHIQQYHQKKK